MRVAVLIVIRFQVVLNLKMGGDEWGGRRERHSRNSERILLRGWLRSQLHQQAHRPDTREFDACGVGPRRHRRRASRTTMRKTTLKSSHRSARQNASSPAKHQTRLCVLHRS